MEQYMFLIYCINYRYKKSFHFQNNAITAIDVSEASYNSSMVYECMIKLIKIIIQVNGNYSIKKELI